MRQIQWYPYHHPLTHPHLQIRDSCDKYANLFVYVYSIDNMRNAKLKDLRSELKESRFFFGKNRVMQLALGRAESDKYKTNLHYVSEVCVSCSRDL